MRRSLATAAGLGMVSGLRTFQGLAWTARALSRDGTRGPLKRLRPAERNVPMLERWLSRGDVARVLGVLASGELAGDKIPGIPDRVALPPLLGRAAAGAAVGAVAAGRGREVAGAAVGASAAVAGAFAGWYLRREAGRASFLPDAGVAMLEDALAVGLARRLVGEG